MNTEKGTNNTEIEISSASLSDLEDAPLAPEPHNFAPRRARQRSKPRWLSNESPIWKWYSFVMTVCTFTLIVVVAYVKRDTSLACEAAEATMTIPRYPHPAEAWNQGSLITRKYYRDTRYMTLDKSMDYLWQDHIHMATGNIRLPDGKGNTTLKSISM